MSPATYQVRRFRHAGALVLLLAAAPNAAVQDGAPALMARIEARQSPNRQGLDPYSIPELMEKFRVAGMSIAVIKDSQIHWAKGYGVADVDNGRPVEPGTMFQAASISKPVTAMAVLKAAQDGRLSIDADVNQILKSWKVPQSDLNKTTPVTLRSLLSHTSGADDGFGFPGYDPIRPAADRAADPERGEAVERRPRIVRAPTVCRIQVFRRRIHHRAARVDGFRGHAVRRRSAEQVFSVRSR